MQKAASSETSPKVNSISRRFSYTLISILTLLLIAFAAVVIIVDISRIDNEMQKRLEDQRALTEEMKRKQEQGSMQLQGEVQELAIEEWLQDNFPLDTIDEVKKTSVCVISA